MKKITKLEEAILDYFKKKNQFRINDLIKITIREKEVMIFIGEKVFYRKISKKSRESKNIFFGFCSNLQAWVEHNYSPNLIEYHLGYSILKELTKLDPRFNEIFEEYECLKYDFQNFL